MGPNSDGTISYVVKFRWDNILCGKIPIGPRSHGAKVPCGQSPMGPESYGAKVPGGQPPRGPSPMGPNIHGIISYVVKLTWGQIPMVKKSHEAKV
jgi:hypothetical protein